MLPSPLPHRRSKSWTRCPRRSPHSILRLPLVSIAALSETHHLRRFQRNLRQTPVLIEATHCHCHCHCHCRCHCHCHRHRHRHRHRHCEVSYYELQGLPLKHLELGSFSRVYSLRIDLRTMTETTQETFVESVSGVKFPSFLTPPGNSSTKLSFAGAGVREKKVMLVNVKVYAVALYIESGVRHALASWRGQSASSLSKNSAFFDSVLNELSSKREFLKLMNHLSSFCKALQLVLLRDITGSQFWGALDEALRPRLKVAEAGAAGDEALAQVARVFQTRPLSSGTTITLNWVHPSTLDVAVALNSSAKATLEASVDNQALVSSIFDIYVGDQPISPGAKSQFAAGLARFV